MRRKAVAVLLLLSCGCAAVAACGGDASTAQNASDAGVDALVDAVSAPDALPVDATPGDAFASDASPKAEDASSDASDGASTLDASDAGASDGSALPDAGPPACVAGNSGWVEATTAENLAGIGTRSWSNAGAARFLDGTYANVSAMVTGEDSNYLLMRAFGLDVPASAIIAGIETEVARKSLSGFAIYDLSLRAVRNGAVVGANRKSDTQWTNVVSVAAYGGPADLWGTTWTPADINQSGFGVALAVRFGGTAGNDWPEVDRIRVRVTWTCP